MASLNWQELTRNSWMAYVVEGGSMCVVVRRKKRGEPWRVEIFGNVFTHLRMDFHDLQVAMDFAEDKAIQEIIDAMATKWFSEGFEHAIKLRPYLKVAQRLGEAVETVLDQDVAEALRVHKTVKHT